MIDQTPIRLLAPQLIKKDLPLLIYLPGMDGTGELFYKQIKFLSPFFSIYCLSISRYNRSNWHQLTEEMIKLIEKEIKENNLDKGVYLCGESFGGCLAIKVALAAPKLVEKMILINPASSFNKRPWLSLGVELTQWIPDFVHQNSTLGFLPFLAALNRIERPDRQALLKAMQSVPKEIVSWRISLLRDFQVEQEELKSLTQPILTIASHKDQLLPSVEEGQELVSYFVRGNLTILPHSGHACLLETEVNLGKMLHKHDFLPTQMNYEL
ncbi:alpha/beta fold hydrolase [Aphanothece sacrum]|uniref:Alpha/beta hydrolase n=1 Tax=Aphanothece sacrum FPU1 TaxID=1920663 RepID=A0A401IG64_APHSA|nr:alpha/beta hydrolase [Aphanothece sacrum]GBF80180.1 alpha/beta hydrolase [Aphanothece sacrum FPU1]GBF85333.1 alpha/beta hydrolase [Aphanothece sacrum FPU3]